jgi:hypothetical protein
LPKGHEILPAIITTYGLFCSHYNDFKCIETENNNFITKLDKNINSLSGSISTRFAFVTRNFIVQNDKDYFTGFVRGKKNNKGLYEIPWESLLFVTEPIASLENRILVILSSVSPAQTTIFSVDSSLKTELLFDSFKNVKGVEIGAIYYIRVLDKNKFLMEARIKPAYTDLYKKGYRTYLLEINKDIQIHEME